MQELRHSNSDSISDLYMKISLAVSDSTTNISQLNKENQKTHITQLASCLTSYEQLGWLIGNAVCRQREVKAI